MKTKANKEPTKPKLVQDAPGLSGSSVSYISSSAYGEYVAAINQQARIKFSSSVGIADAELGLPDEAKELFADIEDPKPIMPYERLNTVISVPSIDVRLHADNTGKIKFYPGMIGPGAEDFLAHLHRIMSFGEGGEFYFHYLDAKKANTFMMDVYKHLLLEVPHFEGKAQLLDRVLNLVGKLRDTYYKAQRMGKQEQEDSLEPSAEHDSSYGVTTCLDCPLFRESIISKENAENPEHAGQLAISCTQQETKEFVGKNKENIQLLMQNCKLTKGSLTIFLKQQKQKI